MFLNSYHIPLPDTHKSSRKRLSNGQVLGLFSDWPFWLCGIVSHLNIFIALMCWTFCQLWCDDLSYLQSSPTNLWGQIAICTRTDSAEKLEIGAFLLFGFCCLGSLYCPRSKLMIDEFVEGWLKRNGWGHGTRTGTLTCRVTLKVNVFELLPHPVPWHSQVIQKTSIKWTSSWPFLWLTLLIVWNCFAFEYFHCFDALDFLPTVVWWLVIPSKFSDKFMGTNCDLHQNWLRREAWDWRLPFVWLLLLGELVLSKVQVDDWWICWRMVEKKWMGTRNTYWHTYVQSNSESKCFWTPTTSRSLTLTSHLENVYQMDKFLAFSLTDPFDCVELFRIWIFSLLWCVGPFANCGVMTCHTFKVLRQIYGDKLWSAPELTPQRSLRLAPSFC